MVFGLLCYKISNKLLKNIRKYCFLLEIVRKMFRNVLKIPRGGAEEEEEEDDDDEEEKEKERQTAKVTAFGSSEAKSKAWWAHVGSNLDLLVIVCCYLVICTASWGVLGHFGVLSRSTNLSDAGLGW